MKSSDGQSQAPGVFALGAPATEAMQRALLDGASLTPADCATRAADALSAARDLADTASVPAQVQRRQVEVLLAVAAGWRELGIAMSSNMAMIPRPKVEIDEPRHV